MGKSPIEWLRNPDGSMGMTWAIITGCKEKSPGCAECYAARLTATRLKHHPKYKGLAVVGANGHPHFTGEMRFTESELLDPLGWKKPQRVFPCDMGDMFHENVPDEWLDKIFAVMAVATWHTFICLTKWPERAKEYLTAPSLPGRIDDAMLTLIGHASAKSHAYRAMALWRINNLRVPSLPLPNVWLLISAERQQEFDERWPYLRNTPAVLRGVSYEPALGPIDFLGARARCSGCGVLATTDSSWRWGNGAVLRPLEHLCAGRTPQAGYAPTTPGIDWIIAGGESKGRSCDVGSLWSAVAQGKAMGIPVFTKQFGSNPMMESAATPGLLEPLRLASSKGNDPSEWPRGPWPREWPDVAR